MNRNKSGLKYLNSLETWNGRGGFNLAAITRVLARLGNPQDSKPSVHIAGTNGKGSVSVAVSSMLAGSGCKVGLNTSPHLQTVHERFIVDGLSVTDAFIGDFAYEVMRASEEAVEKLSYHEAVTALAFLGFREVGVDWFVMEVGLGGLLDASNVIAHPEVAAIVTIDFDHQDILGNSLAEIATQKAGIIKQAGKVVVGQVSKEARFAIEKVARKNLADVKWLGDDFGFLDGIDGALPKYWENFSSELQLTPSLQTVSIQSELLGRHQIHNMSVALAAASTIKLNKIKSLKALEQVIWPGRLETFIAQAGSWTIDCAHNPAGINAFISYLDSKAVSCIDLTFGVLDTKDWEQMVRMLAPYVSRWRLLQPESSRALNSDKIVRLIRELSGSEVRISVYGSEFDRWREDLSTEQPGQNYYATGSVYLIGRLREVLGCTIPPLWEPVQGRTELIEVYEAI